MTLGTTKFGNFLIGWYQQKRSDRDAMQHLLVYACRPLVGAVLGSQHTDPLAYRLKDLEVDLEDIESLITQHNEACDENRDAEIGDDDLLVGDIRQMREANDKIYKILSKLKFSDDRVGVVFMGNAVDLSHKAVGGLHLGRTEDRACRFFQRQMQNALAKSSREISEIPALLGIRSDIVMSYLNGSAEPRGPMEAFTIVNKIIVSDAEVE